MVGRTSILQRTVSFAFFVVSMKRRGGGSNVVWLGELRATASVGWAFRHFFGLHSGAQVESRHFFGLYSAAQVESRHFFGLHSGARVESRHFFGLHSGARVESRHFFGLHSAAQVESRHFFGLHSAAQVGNIGMYLLEERSIVKSPCYELTYSDFMSPTRGPRKVIELLCGMEQATGRRYIPTKH